VIRSMTGFGSADFQVDGVTFGVEIRTVNHRHLDVSVRLPRALSGLEPGARRRVQGCFGRGKVEVSVSLPPGAQAAPTALELDDGLARRYLDFADRLRSDAEAPGELDVGTLLGLPGVARLVEQGLPEERLEAALAGALDEAAGATVAMRTREGEILEKELRGRLAAVTGLITDLDGRAGEVAEAAVERLRRRAEQIRRDTGLGDESRLHQEIVIAADRLDVTEELVRLRSHVEQFEGILDGIDAGESVGRRLEFLLQEMLRETNTIGSKGSDASLAHRVVDIKTELERIREQVLNVE